MEVEGLHLLPYHEISIGLSWKKPPRCHLLVSESPGSKPQYWFYGCSRISWMVSEVRYFERVRSWEIPRGGQYIKKIPCIVAFSTQDKVNDNRNQ